MSVILGEQTESHASLAPPRPEGASGRAPALAWLPPLRTSTLLQLVLLGGVFVLNFFSGTDPDYWWHLATGRLIVETGTIPTTDPFSYTAVGRPWVAHEWLAEIVMYQLYRVGGYVALVVLFGAVVTAAMALVLRTLRLMGVGVVPAVGLVVWISTMSIPFWNVRPQVFSMLFVAASLYLLIRSRSRSDRWLWLLPAMMVPWVNLHAGYVMGLMLPVLFLIGEAFNRIRQARLKEDEARPGATGAQQYLAVLLATLAATVVNPQGPAMLLYPFTYAGTQNASMKYITEWQSPDFHEYYMFIFAASFLVLIVAPARRGVDWALALPFLVFTAMTLQSARVMAFYSIVAAPMLASRLLHSTSTRADVVAGSRRSRGNRLNWVLLPLCLIVMGSTLFMTDRAQIGREPRTEGYPVEGVAYIKERGLTGNLFNTYHWGGYLIWSLYPERRAFIDGRADMYGDQFMEQYSQAIKGSRHWDGLVEAHSLDAVLIEKDSPLEYSLLNSGQWQPALYGKVEVLLLRTLPARS